VCSHRWTSISALKLVLSVLRMSSGFFTALNAGEGRKVKERKWRGEMRGRKETNEGKRRSRKREGEWKKEKRRNDGKEGNK
jgi:hypothetical protein